MSSTNLQFRIGYHPEIQGGIVEQTERGVGAYFWHTDRPTERVLVPQDVCITKTPLPEWAYARREALQAFARVIIYVESTR